MAVSARYFTDPLCPLSWALEPMLRRLEVEFAGSLRIEPVPVGLYREPVRESEDLLSRTRELAEVARVTRMPVDPTLWLGSDPPRSSHPACIAVCAALERDREIALRLLRRLREAALCGERRVDSPLALVECAVEVGLSREGFERNLESNATLERFAAAIESARQAARDAGGLRTTPLLEVTLGERRLFAGVDEGGGVERLLASCERLLSELRAAGLAVGEAPPTDAAAALARWGSLSTAELAAVTEWPWPRAAAELWRLVLEWRARPLLVAGGGALFRTQ